MIKAGQMEDHMASEYSREPNRKEGSIVSVVILLINQLRLN